MRRKAARTAEQCLAETSAPTLKEQPRRKLGGVMAINGGKEKIEKED